MSMDAQVGRFYSQEPSTCSQLYEKIEARRATGESAYSAWCREWNSLRTAETRSSEVRNIQESCGLFLISSLASLRTTHVWTLPSRGYALDAANVGAGPGLLVRVARKT